MGINVRPSYNGPEYRGLSPEERMRQVQRDQNQWDLLEAQRKANELKERELNNSHTYTSINTSDYTPKKYNIFEILYMALAFGVAIGTVIVGIYVTISIILV